MRFNQLFPALCFVSIMLAGQLMVNAQLNGEGHNGNGPAIGLTPNPNDHGENAHGPSAHGKRDLNSFSRGINANYPRKFGKRQAGSNGEGSNRPGIGGGGSDGNRDRGGNGGDGPGKRVSIV